MAPADLPGHGGAIDRELSEANLRFLARGLTDRLPKNGWPAYSGKAFVLSLVANGALQPNEESLQRLFSPADKARSLEIAGGTTPYKALTKASLRAGGDFGALTSYVGRRNAEREHAIVERDGVVPVLADLSLKDGVLVAYTDGSVKWHSYADLGLVPTDKLEVGEAAKSPILRVLSN